MFLRINGSVTHVQVDGADDAPALLLLHSLGTSLHLWDAAARHFSARFRVVRPDLRGHGLSETNPAPCTVEALAADALDVLDALGIGAAHVAGVSIGGMVAQAIAHRAPARVWSLCLVDTALAIPPPDAWTARAAMVRAQGMGAVADAVLARWVTRGFRDAPAAQGLRAMLMATPPEGYAGAAEAIAAADLHAATAQLRVPALVMVGDQDEATPPASARALCAAIPGASLVVLPGVAHLPMAERPDAVTEAMASFLDAQEAARPSEAAEGATQPPLDSPRYASTARRHPTQAPVRPSQPGIEQSGPQFTPAQFPPLADMARNAEGREAVGERIIVSGRVTDTDGRPLPHTMIELWQANAAGRYQHAQDQHDAPLDPNFSGVGRVFTDADGRYRFTTVKPGAYPWHNHANAWRPNHIHFSLFGRGFGSRLVTQMYFPGDPLLELDPIFNAIPDRAARHRLVSRFDMATTQPHQALGYVFDIVLGPGGHSAGATPLEA